MPETIAAAEASPAVRRVTLTDRTGAALYVNERTATGAWRREPTAADALHSLRARPLPPDEVAAWLMRHRDIAVDFAVRGELNATTLPVLRQAADAHAVAAVSPAPDSAARRSHAAVRPLLMALNSAPISTIETLSPNLAPDGDLTKGEPYGPRWHEPGRSGDRAAPRAPGPRPASLATECGHG
ncbi:hypothetical protein [Streptomyces lavendulocolor]|uniref:hypothetical protein n=1 Tax=Streptomyces lavendulocolor TaxID=67316 RepID=UPI003C2C619B